MVLYSKTQNGNREEVQAIHAVPNQEWIINRHQRMSSFDKKDINMNLSTGCVNLEGYSYDILNEYIGDKCPIYILPEDEKNYYAVKNGLLKFTTNDRKRKNQKENSSNRDVKGRLSVDRENINIYRYTPKNKNNNIKFPIGEFKKSPVLMKLLGYRDELYRRAVAIESDDFEDILSLTASIESNPIKAKDVFLNLYRSFYREKISDDESVKVKRFKILNRYKQDFNPNVRLNFAVKKSLGIDYDYK